MFATFEGHRFGTNSYRYQWGMCGGIYTQRRRARRDLEELILLHWDERFRYRTVRIKIPPLKWCKTGVNAKLIRTQASGSLTPPRPPSL